MTITRTARTQQQQWSSGQDGPTRAGFNLDAQRADERFALDFGDTNAALPVVDTLAGRYFRQSHVDGHTVHRYSGSAWEVVGGSVIPIQQKFRRASGSDVALSTDIAGATPTFTVTAGGEVATSGNVRSSAVGAFGANTDVTLTPSAVGRLYARTRADGERAVVAEAHGTGAGPLFSAREVGGGYPWIIDSRGRMRAQLAAGFGGASVADTVPVGIAPSDGSATALDLYGKVTGAIPALRAFREIGDSDGAILSIQPDIITIGRTTWPGAVLNLRAPVINAVGNLAVTGNVTATGGGTLAGAQAAIGGTLTAENNKITTYVSGSDAGLRTQLVTDGSVTANRDARQPLIWRKRFVNIDFTTSSLTSVQMHVFEFTPRTTCNINVNLTAHFRMLSDGSSGADIEPNTVAFRLRILDENDSVLYSGDEIYEETLGAFDRFSIRGRGVVPVSDCPPILLVAGTTYQIQLFGHRASDSSISTVLRHVYGTVQEVALIGS